MEIIFLVCYVAIILGDVIIFYAGRLFGAALLKKKWIHARIPADRLESFKVQLEKRSLLTIFIARHLFYVRTATFITCGAVHMRLSRFLLADLLAALISVPLMLSLGYFFSENFEAIIESIKQAKIFSLILVAVIAVFYLIYHSRRMLRQSRDTEQAAECVEPAEEAPKDRCSNNG